MVRSHAYRLEVRGVPSTGAAVIAFSASEDALLPALRSCSGSTRQLLQQRV